MKKMDLRHTGSSELVYIATDKVNVTIKGNASHPSAPGVEYLEKSSILKTYCSDRIKTIMIKNEELDGSKPMQRLTPIFFEQSSYEIIVEGTEGNSVSFWHENKLVRDKVTSASRKFPLLSGIINFGNEIGMSDLVILVNGEKYLKITVEVFPSKISYQEDYKNIVADVTEEIYNVAFDFLKKTYQGYQQSANRKSSSTEFFSIITEIFQNFQKSVDKIINQSYHLLETYCEVLPSYKIRKSDKKTRRWVEKHPSYAKRVGSNIYVDKAMSVKKQITFDNKENRLVKYMLKETVKRLELLKKQYFQLQRQEDYVITDKINTMIKNINRRINNSFLSEVESVTANTGMSLVFSMAPGYRELYKYYLMLQRGLDITGDVFNISVKDLAILYEYWCFIKLNSILKDKYDLISQDIIRAEGNSLTVTLVKGQNSRVKYRNAKNGEVIILSYNPKSGNLPTVSQKPDNVLSLVKNSYDENKPKYEYVFDAKYKMDPAIEGSHYYNNISHIPGPKEEDINTMHRYRDAIVSDQGVDNFERTMFGAYVLFPYSDEEKYKAHRFYKSIEKVNIGGLPFLPSATNLVEDMLDDLIADSPETAFDRTTLPLGIESKLEKIDWDKRDVLVGKVNNQEELDAFIHNNFYYIPCNKINKNDFPIHYVALYQPKNVFGDNSGVQVYGEVLRTAKMERSSIKELSSDKDELYYKFAIKEWTQLQRDIAVKERADDIMFTNMFLLQHSFNISDLRLQNEEEYRLYVEVKRLINSEFVNETDHPLCFKYGDFVIDYQDGNICLLEGKKILEQYSAALFNKRPNYWFRKIRESMKI